MSDYYSIPTTLGAAKLAAAANNNQALTLSHMAFGDANGVPYLPITRVNATELVNERYRIAVQYVVQDTANPNVYIIKARIPANIGGFDVSELAIFDTTGDMIYLANYPRTFKPQITQGAGGELTIKIHVMTSHTDAISIILDPHVITLTQDEGDNRYALKTELDSEALTRENNDLALAVALAAEITNRENAVAQANFAVFDNETTYTTAGTHTFIVPANVNRVIVELQAAGGGGGQGGGNDGGAEIGGGGGGAASGQWLSVLIFNLVAGDEIVITIGARGLGGHSGSTPATAGGDVSFSITGRANSLTLAKGGRAGAKGLPGDDNGSNPSYRGQGGTLWGSSSVKMRFCTRVADIYEESGEGGLQLINGGKGGDSLFGEGGTAGAGHPTVGAGGNGTLGSGGGGGGGGTGTGGGAGGDGGDGFANVYW